MCARYALFGPFSPGNLVPGFVEHVVNPLAGFAHYNIAPSLVNPVVVAGGGGPGPGLESMRWGLLPSWAKDEKIGTSMINARIETVAEKPSFKDSFLRRRAAVPASGYFEWQTASDGTKRPFYINAGDDGLFAFAAVYEWWLDETKAKDDPSRWLLSTAILTKDASGSIEHIHDRSPVFLSPESLDHWLNPAVIGDAALLSEISTDSVRVAEEILFHQVGSEVGSVRNNEPNLIRPIS